MKSITRIFYAIILTALAGFCIFGFLASGEMENPMSGRIIYGILGGAAGCTVAWLFRPSRSAFAKD